MLPNGVRFIGHSNGAAQPIPIVKRKRANPGLANDQPCFATYTAVPSVSSGSKAVSEFPDSSPAVHPASRSPDTAPPSPRP